MARKIEQLLRVAADYQKFCNINQNTSGKKESEYFELKEHELDTIAAAAQFPEADFFLREQKKNPFDSK